MVAEQASEVSLCISSQSTHATDEVQGHTQCLLPPRSCWLARRLFAFTHDAAEQRVDRQQPQGEGPSIMGARGRRVGGKFPRRDGHVTYATRATFNLMAASRSLPSVLSP